MPEIGPALVLAVLVGTFHAGLYLFIRGRFGRLLPAVLLASILGALAGQAVGSRLGDPLAIGDFGLLWSSLVAWVGIAIVVVAAMLAPPTGR